MPDELTRLGPRLRAARQARGWTLDELATRARMSPSTLSRLESGKRQATLELLLPLTAQLGIRIDDLIRPEAADPRVRRPVIHRDGLVIAPLAPADSSVHTYKITYPPTGSGPHLKTHTGFEWLYVLSGRVRLVLGEAETILVRGEAAEFDTRTPHSISAAGQRPAQVISIFNEEGMRIHTHSQHEEGGF